MAEAKKYRVLIGLNYGERRAEPGDVVDDLPDKSISALVKKGAIEDASKPKAKAPKAEEE